MVLFCALLWADHFRETTLPSPSGSFAVGRTMLTWTVPTRTPEITGPGTLHTIIAWIWYPADPPPKPLAMAEYLPDPWRLAVQEHSGALLSNILTRDLSRVRTHSLPDAPMSPRQRSYPVVLIRAGLAAETTSLHEHRRRPCKSRLRGRGH